jgi:hypothetical protein
MEEYIASVKTCEGSLRVGYDELDRSYVIVESTKTDQPWHFSLTAQQCEILETSLRICRQSIRKS